MSGSGYLAAVLAFFLASNLSAGEIECSAHLGVAGNPDLATAEIERLHRAQPIRVLSRGNNSIFFFLVPDAPREVGGYQNVGGHIFNYLEDHSSNYSFVKGALGRTVTIAGLTTVTLAVLKPDSTAIPIILTLPAILLAVDLFKMAKVVWDLAFERPALYVLAGEINTRSLMGTVEDVESAHVFTLFHATNRKAVDLLAKRLLMHGWHEGEGAIHAVELPPLRPRELSEAIRE